MVIIDGSTAMWNAVLRAFANETKLEYYHRYWRIVIGKAGGGDLNKMFVLNCFNHAMRAAKNFVFKYYKCTYKSVAMFWVNVFFSVTSFNQLESVMDSIMVVTNCERTSRLKHSSGDLDLNYNFYYSFDESDRDPIYGHFLNSSKWID